MPSDRQNEALTAPRPGWGRGRPILAILASQIVATALLTMVLPSDTDMTLRLLAMGAAAGVIGLALGLGRNWLPLQFVLPLAMGGLYRLALPSWIYLVAFGLLLLVYWNSARGKVPLYLSNRKTHEALAALIPSGTVAVADLGSGLGGVVLALARARPEARVVGFESAPLPFLLARIRLALTGLPNASLVYADFWKEPLTPFDLVYAFLSPVPMADLYDKAQAEMRPGTALVSNSFEVPGVNASAVTAVDDRRQTRLYRWVIEPCRN
jgi:precorrin-6B methylase 2